MNTDHEGCYLCHLCSKKEPLLGLAQQGLCWSNCYGTTRDLVVMWLAAGS